MIKGFSSQTSSTAQFFEVHLRGLEFPRASPCPASCLRFKPLPSLFLLSPPNWRPLISHLDILKQVPKLTSVLPNTPSTYSACMFLPHHSPKRHFNYSHKNCQWHQLPRGQLQPSQPHLTCCFPFIGLSVLQVPWPCGLSSLS